MAYYAHKAGLGFTVYEASSKLGGNAQTLEHQGFYFDTGAHRLHHKDDEATAVYRQLLGNDLLEVDAPSAIYHHGQFIDFPLSPLDLTRKLGAGKTLQAAWSLLKSRLSPISGNSNFEANSVNTYGRYLADQFLLHYTEKLWGRPAHQLATEISGARLKGLDIWTFLQETFGGKARKTRHLDGRFYYPRQGIGQLMQAVVEHCGAAHFRTNTRITQLHHTNGQVDSITINDQETVVTGTVVSTLPLNLVPKLLSPPASNGILQVASDISFRHLLLVVVLLNKPQVTPHATLYFTTPGWEFTRVVEPRNRSAYMSKVGTTSLVAEVPIDSLRPDSLPAMQQRVLAQLISTGLIETGDVIDVTSQFIPNAYPILETSAANKRQQLYEYLKGFGNLHLVGRNASFSYTHIHDQFMAAKRVIEEIRSKG